MPINVTRTLRLALRQLERERDALDQKIAALRTVVAPESGLRRPGEERTGRRRHKRMSAAARKAISRRMKKYWAGRRKAQKRGR
jgi:hypothetical protein